ncbi:hypothetical protein SARC_10752, partial [Sphaeroforma arctica JP610]
YKLHTCLTMSNDSNAVGLVSHLFLCSVLLRSGGRFWHVIIKEEERGFFYVHTGEAFQTKMELLAYYVTHQLSDTLPTRLLHCVNVNELSLYDCID